MNIQFFDDNSLVPQPRDKVKIESLRIAPYPDRFRVFIELKVTPFQERPNLILVLRNSESLIVNELTVIETMHAHMEFTMHIRGVSDPTGQYTLTAVLFYETKHPPQDERTESFQVEPSNEI